MSEIKLSREGAACVTVPSGFLSDYMPQANGEYVKIYLYLLWILESGRELSASSMADALDVTEKDVKRAFKYWESKGVLSLTYEQTRVTAIRLLAPWENMEPDAAGKPDEMPAKADNAVPSVYDYSLTPAQILDTQSDPGFEAFVHVIKSNFKPQVNNADYEILMWVYTSLGRDYDACEALAEHWIKSSKRRSIKTLQKLCTECLDYQLSDAKSIKNHWELPRIYNMVKETIGEEQGLGSWQKGIIDEWVLKYKIPEDMIQFACKKASSRSGNRISYANTVICGWAAKGIITLEGAKKDDEEHNRRYGADKHPEGGSRSASSKNKFNDGDLERSYDEKELEAMVFGYDIKKL